MAALQGSVFGVSSPPWGRRAGAGEGWPPFAPSRRRGAPGIQTGRILPAPTELACAPADAGSRFEAVPRNRSPARTNTSTFPGTRRGVPDCFMLLGKALGTLLSASVFHLPAGSSPLPSPAGTGTGTGGRAQAAPERRDAAAGPVPRAERGGGRRCRSPPSALPRRAAVATQRPLLAPGAAAGTPAPVPSRPWRLARGRGSPTPGEFGE